MNKENGAKFRPENCCKDWPKVVAKVGQKLLQRLAKSCCKGWPKNCCKVRSKKLQNSAEKMVQNWPKKGANSTGKMVQNSAGKMVQNSFQKVKSSAGKICCKIRPGKCCKIGRDTVVINFTCYELSEQYQLGTILQTLNLNVVKDINGKLRPL